jgi:hypothetical protein
MTRNHILGVAAIIFGLASVVSGGTVLFGPAEAREAAGSIVPFVVWFNFALGAVYMVAGVGVFLTRQWGRTLGMVIAAAIALVLAAFLWHALSGGAWEPRTLGAMIVRLAFWLLVVAFAASETRGFIRPGADHG